MNKPFEPAMTAHQRAAVAQAELEHVRAINADLLAALREIEAWQNGSPLVGGRGLPPEIATKMRAAIAKATGSSQPGIAKARG